MLKKRILAVDDEEGILRILEGGLSGDDFTVITASDGPTAIDRVRQEEPDLVVLDLVMPGFDGFEVCRQIRAFSSVPIIILTGLRNEKDIIRGLDAGADEYVTKPFSVVELGARVRAMLRRVETLSARPAETSVSCDNGRVLIDFDRRSVVSEGRRVPLSDTEFRLLSYLVANAGRVVTHDRIIEHVWGSEHVSQTSYLRTYIGLLRRKIERDQQHPRIIVSSHGIGYSFRTDQSSVAPSPAG